MEAVYDGVIDGLVKFGSDVLRGSELGGRGGGGWGGLMDGEKKK